MKITRNIPKPQPVTITMELTLDELIALKTFAEHYRDLAVSVDPATAITLAAGRFVVSVSEKPYSWGDTDALFR